MVVVLGIIACCVVAVGILALLFYVVYVVKPKRVKVSARVWKLGEMNLEADGESSEPGKPPGEIAHPESRPALPGNGLKALPGGEQKTLP
jgi:hypothetical protein